MAELRSIEDIILAKLIGETLSIEEEQRFEIWLEESRNKGTFVELQRITRAIWAVNSTKDIDEKYEWQKIISAIQKKRGVLRAWKYAVAASVALVCGIGIWFALQRESLSVTKDYIRPGRMMATLTLSDGRQYMLNNRIEGQLSEDNGVIIQQTETRQLTYQVKDSTVIDKYNTLEVPRGGEYILTLSDGSTIWLNSESRLTYPTVFTGETREVMLKGEAYFDIEKDSIHPFIVHSDKMDVRVLGTLFNMRAYPNEEQSTTLVSGAVELKSGNQKVHLRPGEQGKLSNNQLEVHQVHVGNFIAWKNGEFNFKGCRLEDIFNELARWYDLEPCFQDQNARDYVFTAWFKRSASIEEVISILEKTKDIKIKLSGRTMIITVTGKS